MVDLERETEKGEGWRDNEYIEAGKLWITPYHELAFVLPFIGYIKV